jgi:hypothetical protein
MGQNVSIESATDCVTLLPDYQSSAGEINTCTTGAHYLADEREPDAQQSDDNICDPANSQMEKLIGIPRAESDQKL